MHPLTIWSQAIRPKTLWAAVAPVFVGTAMAVSDGGFHAPSAVAALLFAVLVQVGTNLCNDYADFKKGADTEERQGPIRVTQAGLLTPEIVLRGAVLVFALALLVSGYLVWRGGFILAVLAVLAVLSGVLYTAGPYPLGYLGLGDLFVLVFFGPVAVGATHYVQARYVSHLAVVAGLGAGLLSVAILVVNNLRDADTDAKAGKRTLAVRFGRGFARGEYVACILGAAMVPLALVLHTREHIYALATLVMLPLAWPAVRKVLTSDRGHVLNPVLGQTAKLLLIYSLLFSVGWLL